MVIFQRQPTMYVTGGSITAENDLGNYKNLMFNFVSLLKYKRQMTDIKQIMCKPALLRCAGLHNLLPVIWRLYFNKLTKLIIQFLNNLNMYRVNRSVYCLVRLFSVRGTESNFLNPSKHSRLSGERGRIK